MRVHVTPASWIFVEGRVGNPLRLPDDGGRIREPTLRDLVAFLPVQPMHVPERANGR